MEVSPPGMPEQAAQALPAAPEMPAPSRPLALPQTEEDLFEIPSFLRRQAN